jgi:hypothetical protein
MLAPRQLAWHVAEHEGLGVVPGTMHGSLCLPMEPSDPGMQHFSSFRPRFGLKGKSVRHPASDIHLFCSSQLKVDTASNGDQKLHLTTNLQAGRLLLHWGVEGGKDYKGGWRLPAARPEGTMQYKDRALQTPFRWA